MADYHGQASYCMGFRFLSAARHMGRYETTTTVPQLETTLKKSSTCYMAKETFPSYAERRERDEPGSAVVELTLNA